jgi:hypothetical protein
MSIKDIFRRGTTRQFVPAKAPERTIPDTRYTPPSYAVRPRTRDQVKLTPQQIIRSTPAERQQFAQREREYQQQLLEAKRLADATERMGGAYEEYTKAYERLQEIEKQKISSIKDLEKAIKETEATQQDLKQEIAKVQAADDAKIATFAAPSVPKKTMTFIPTETPLQEKFPLLQTMVDKSIQDKIKKGQPLSFTEKLRALNQGWIRR